MKPLSIKKAAWLLAVFIFFGLYQNCAKSFQTLGSIQNSSFNVTNTYVGTGSVAEQNALAILNARCFACHGGTNNQGGISDILNIGHLVSSGLVLPGNAYASQLYDAVAQSRMPIGGALLTPTEINAIKIWIDGPPHSTTTTIATTTSTLPATTTTMPATTTTTAPGTTTTTMVPSTTTTTIATTTTSTTMASAYTYTYVYNNILQTKCLACHRSGYAQKGVRYDTYAETLKTVIPGNATSSNLYNQVQSGKMPPKPSPVLNSTELQYLRNWINAGAPNN